MPRFHLHHHFDRDPALSRIEDTLKALDGKVDRLMATVQEFADALARIDAATTKIGAGIQVLLDRIAAGGMSEAEESQALADIGTRAALLESIAADVENPVPVEPPPVEEPPAE